MPSRGPAARLERLLYSLSAQTIEVEVIVVDNASSGREVTRLCEGHGGATVLTLEENLGFSRAVNLGAERASGDALILVNDDCRCDPGFAEALLAALDPTAGIGMAAGVLRDASRTGHIDTAGLVIDATLLAYDHLSGEPVEVLEGDVPDPFGPSGAAAAYDREAFVELGGFDERLFAYWEDTDLALRMVRSGRRCRLAPAALGDHEHSATLGPGSRAKNRLTGFGRGYVLRKWSVMTPRRAGPVMAREIGVLAGQAVKDRDLSGFGARLAGWRAAEDVEDYPELDPALLSRETVPRMLARRVRRRS